MPDLTDDQLNSQLAEALGWHTEYHNRSCAEDDSGWLLRPPMRSMPAALWDRNAVCDSEAEAWDYSPLFATDIVAALWAFQEAEKRAQGKRALLQPVVLLWLMCPTAEKRDALDWLLLDGTARKLAEAALKALQAEKGE